MKTTLPLFLLLSALIAYGQPVIQPGSTVNAADYSRDLAPGGILTVFGLNLAAEYIPASTLPLPTSLGGTSVELVDGGLVVPLPLFYVLPKQVSAQAPFDVTVGKAYAIRVRTSAGLSVSDTVTFTAVAPKYFTVNQEGFGRVVAADLNGEFLLRSNPMMPGDWYVLYANSMGQTDMPATAGAGAGNDGSTGPLNQIKGDVKVVINNREAVVDWAGLVPDLAGLYQINVVSPYNELLGDVGAQLMLNGVASQAEMTLPVEPNGAYYVYSGGKFPNGQSRTGVPGQNSAIAFRHEDPQTWGADGFREWTLNTTMESYHEETSGLALTLMNNAVIVYDNNGIEDGTFADYYNNTGANSDLEKAGLWEWYSNVNDDYAIFATCFKLTQPATFNKIIGYFDNNGRAELRFNPDNLYNTYRMNIWSTGSGGRPANNDVIGDVFYSGSTPGAFTRSQTTAARVFSNGARDDIYRLVYTLAQPITLQPGEYWFSHDLMVPKPLANPNPGEPVPASAPGPMQIRKAARGSATKPNPGPPAGPGQ